MRERERLDYEKPLIHKLTATDNLLMWLAGTGGLVLIWLTWLVWIK